MAEIKYICQGATLFCSNGNKKSQLGVVPLRNVYIEGKPMANILDHKPMINIFPFGLCHTLNNPEVKAATAANHGNLTPMPCRPNTQTPWIAGKRDVDVQMANGVLETSCLHCMWQGVIKAVQHGQDGPGFVSTGAERVEHESFSCDIPQIKLKYKKKGEEKSVVVYDRGEKEEAFHSWAHKNAVNREAIAEVRKKLTIIDRLPDKIQLDHAILANECYGDSPKYISKTNYMKITSDSLRQGSALWRLADVVEKANATEKKTGFHAELYYNDITGEYVLGFAGSGLQLADWIGNGQQALGYEFAQQKLTNEIINEINNLPLGVNISLVGHSLGGSLASYVGLATGRPTSTYNSEGISDKILEANGLLEKKQRHDYNIKAYYNDADILSNIQDAIPSSNYMASAIGDRVNLGDLNSVWDKVANIVMPTPIGSAMYGVSGHSMTKIIDHNLSTYGTVQEIWQTNMTKLSDLSSL